VNRANSSDRNQGVPEWPVRIHKLGEDPGDDLTDATTPEERIAMVWELTARAWMLTGLALPEYSRQETPVRVLRPA
jgi:hypothetical protein